MCCPGCQLNASTIPLKGTGCLWPSDWVAHATVAMCKSILDPSGQVYLLCTCISLSWVTRHNLSLADFQAYYTMQKNCYIVIVVIINTQFLLNQPSFPSDSRLGRVSKRRTFEMLGSFLWTRFPFLSLHQTNNVKAMASQTWTIITFRQRQSLSSKWYWLHATPTNANASEHFRFTSPREAYKTSRWMDWWINYFHKFHSHSWLRCKGNCVTWNRTAGPLYCSC